VQPATVLMLRGLLTRDPTNRLGCGECGKNNLKYHPFFDGLDWDKLEGLELSPPYIPKKNGGKVEDDSTDANAGTRDISNFDSEFTRGGKISVGGKGAANEELVGFGHEFQGFSFVDQSLSTALTEARALMERMEAEAETEVVAAPTPEASPDSSPVKASAKARCQSMLIRQASCNNAAEQLHRELAGTAWYKPELNRKAVFSVLFDTPAGTFYVRPSTYDNAFALTVSVGEGKKPWSGLISMVEVLDGSGDLVFRLFADDKFETIHQVLLHYSQHSLIAEDTILLILP
jgi:hypothetical protein